MNVYEAMRYIRTQVTKRNNNSELWSSLDKIERVADAYDALAPDWANAPDWAQWYCVDASGDAQWTQKEPEASDGTTGWIFGTAWEDAAGPNGIDLPLGIDWRLCKWSRPEVTK